MWMKSIDDKKLVDGAWKLFKFWLFMDFNKKSKLGYSWYEWKLKFVKVLNFRIKVFIGVYYNYFGIYVYNCFFILK